MESTTFTVDAALLRELGERLIGRSYIALAELVKNSYDADATDCMIEFSGNQIAVSDNGNGMSEREFHTHWMRIGTTHKNSKRISSRLGRPMTGSKGLGRLSVQFLAEKMTLESSTAADSWRYLHASVDWTGIRRGKDISTVQVQWEMRPGKRKYPNGRTTGTTVVLKTLRSKWDANAIEHLGKQVWTLQSPFMRSDPPSATDFHVDIDAPDIDRAAESFGGFQKALFDNWKARIHGVLVDGRTDGKATISVEFKTDYPKGVNKPTYFDTVSTLPITTKKRKDSRSSIGPAIDRAEFDILIFKPDGKQHGGISVSDLRTYLREFGNVSVYDGGFRLPYYGASHDWLHIATDQGRRLVTSALLPPSLHIRERYLLDLPAPGRIFGSVEIDTNHERSVADHARATPGECLHISPGRDRLADNSAYDQLCDMVRFSLDFYANRYCLLRVQATEQTRAKEEPPSQIYGRAIAILDDNRDEVSENAYRQIRRELVSAKTVAATEEEVIDRRAAMLAPLATAGMTALALNHELAREIFLLERARDRLRAIIDTAEMPELIRIADDIDAAAGRFDALRQLFDPLLSGEDLEATDRLKVRAIVRQVIGAFEPLMGRVTFELGCIPEQLRFPVGSLAEWSAMLQNVLTNSWNAMLDADRASVVFEGGRGPRAREWLRVSDTGVGLGVSLEDSEMLFKPFERGLRISDENESIAMGGQGLGLAIVRMIAQRRGVRVAFVQPKPGFVTTVEISWNGTPE